MGIRPCDDRYADRHLVRPGREGASSPTRRVVGTPRARRHAGDNERSRTPPGGRPEAGLGSALLVAGTATEPPRSYLIREELLGQLVGDLLLELGQVLAPGPFEDVHPALVLGHREARHLVGVGREDRLFGDD